MGDGKRGEIRKEEKGDEKKWKGNRKRGEAM